MLVIICVYGLFTFIIQSNPIYDLISNSFSGDLGIWANVQERGYRVCSFLSNPIVYGGVMGMYSLIVLNVWKTNNKLFKYIVFALLLLSVLIANSRTSIFATLVAYILYFLLKNKLSYKNILAAFSAVIIVLIMYNQFGFIRPMMDSAIDLVTTGGVNTQGSTTDLKVQQWEVSLLSFYDAPFFGHGLSYFYEVMGNKDSFVYNPLIAGMEGYQYKLLIEQGGFMIIAVIIFYIQLLAIFFKKRIYSQTISYTGIACTISFLFFICATGVYGSAFLHFGIYIGILLRCVYDKRFSILIPAFNVDKYIDKCIQSILNQSHANFEVIIIDDGSTDETLKICKKYESIDSRIKVFHQLNMGIVETRNRLIKLANGNWVVFIDADDYVKENYLSCFTNYINEFPDADVLSVTI